MPGILVALLGNETGGSKCSSVGEHESEHTEIAPERWLF